MRSGNKTKGLVILILSLFQLYSCKHDAFEPPVVSIPEDSVVTEERCFDYDSILQECNVGPFYNDLSPAYMFPTINPNNPNEFAYYVDKQVYKYNMETKTNTLLADDIWVISRMDWGAQGWITFSHIGWKVWVLKEDGSELRQITFGERDLGSDFNSDGSLMIYSDTQPLDKSKMFIVDIKGNKIDSFCRVRGNDCYSWDYCAWSKDAMYFAAPNKGVTLYNSEGLPLKTPFPAGQDVADIPDIEWLPDNENIVFITRYGNNRGTIYNVNVNTEEVTMIKEGCENRFYSDLAISPDGNFMLAQKGIAEVDGCDVDITWRIVKMNLDGSNEEIIELPEP